MKKAHIFGAFFIYESIQETSNLLTASLEQITYCKCQMKLFLVLKRTLIE
ncbi:hypothetical protein J690_0603 [Acinetobacter sp. 742879]|nr:hypothetical protein J690_0603 [Acinetobacter sp. 742879]